MKTATIYQNLEISRHALADITAERATLDDTHPGDDSAEEEYDIQRAEELTELEAILSITIAKLSHPTHEVAALWPAKSQPSLRVVT